MNIVVNSLGTWLFCYSWLFRILAAIRNQWNAVGRTTVLFGRVHEKHWMLFSLQMTNNVAHLPKWNSKLVMKLLLCITLLLLITSRNVSSSSSYRVTPPSLPAFKQRSDTLDWQAALPRSTQAGKCWSSSCNSIIHWGLPKSAINVTQYVCLCVCVFLRVCASVLPSNPELVWVIITRFGPKHTALHSPKPTRSCSTFFAAKQVTHARASASNMTPVAMLELISVKASAQKPRDAKLPRMKATISPPPNFMIDLVKQKRIFQQWPARFCKPLPATEAKHTAGKVETCWDLAPEHVMIRGSCSVLYLCGKHRKTASQHISAIQMFITSCPLNIAKSQ